MHKLSALLLLVATVAADYSYTVSLLRIENPSGLLANGQPCSEFAFAGTQCSMSATVVVNNNPSDLGRISDSSNVVLFTEKEYNGWNNPQSFSLGMDTVFQGINITVSLYSANDNATIDSFTFTAATSDQTKGINSYTSIKGTIITVAWITDLPQTTTAAPTTPQQTTETPTQPQTTATSAPVTEVDCEDYTDRTNGVKKILIGDQIVPVYCQYGGTKGSLTAIQSRGNINITSFDKTLVEYKSLFGTAGKGGDFWIGLDNMNNLTNTGSYGLRIDLCCNGVGTVQTYPNVKIGGADSGYKLSTDVSSSTGLNLKNINTLKSDNGQPFITYREANETFMGVCDILRYYGPEDTPIFDNSTGGWWFGSCSNNLNGALVSTVDQNTCGANFTTPAGAGIEMRTTTGSIGKGDDERYFDGVSYDRVRMSLYRMDNPVLGLSDNAYCS